MRDGREEQGGSVRGRSLFLFLSFLIRFPSVGSLHEMLAKHVERDYIRDGFNFCISGVFRGQLRVRP